MADAIHYCIHFKAFSNTAGQQHILQVADSCTIWLINTNYTVSQKNYTDSVGEYLNTICI